MAKDEKNGHESGSLSKLTTTVSCLSKLFCPSSAGLKIKFVYSYEKSYCHESRARKKKNSSPRFRGGRL